MNWAVDKLTPAETDGIGGALAAGGQAAIDGAITLNGSSKPRVDGAALRDIGLRLQNSVLIVDR